MLHKPLFIGLIFDEDEQPVNEGYVGEEPCYIVDDSGFKRHISSKEVDRQILNTLIENIKENEDLFLEQATKMLGNDDIFTRAMVKTQLKQLDQQIDKIFETGIPEEGRAYMGMMGFKIIIDHHGDIVSINQPGGIIDEE
ncbi:MAG: hypothetical protein JEZ06_11980 [Anaerolineaceae bacterium]|nr:hypothetical protein [Anaerolineaceae bacterium]